MMANPSVRCAWTPETCIDDMCRGSVERGLCGNWRQDALDDMGDDGIDDEYWWGDDDPSTPDNNVPGQHT
jgi:hypothetical protein